MTSDRTLWGALGTLLFLFVLSLALYLWLPGNLVRTTLRFPDELTHRLSYEVRSLPFTGEREHNIELTVREILLGPARHQHLRLFSRLGQVRGVLVRGSTVYVDLTEEAFFPDKDVIYSSQVALNVLKATLMDNFAGVSEVMISVGGEPVGGNLVDKG